MRKKPTTFSPEPFCQHRRDTGCRLLGDPSLPWNVCGDAPHRDKPCQQSWGFPGPGSQMGPRHRSNGVTQCCPGHERPLRLTQKGSLMAAAGPAPGAAPQPVTAGPDPGLLLQHMAVDRETSFSAMMGFPRHSCPPETPSPSWGQSRGKAVAPHSGQAEGSSVRTLRAQDLSRSTSRPPQPPPGALP